MEFYIQACIDLVSKDFFYIAKSTAIQDFALSSPPEEDDPMYELEDNGIPVVIPGEETLVVPHSERHIIKNYWVRKVSGSFDSINLYEEASLLDNELKLTDDYKA